MNYLSVFHTLRYRSLLNFLAQEILVTILYLSVLFILSSSHALVRWRLLFLFWSSPLFRVIFDRKLSLPLAVLISAWTLLDIVRLMDSFLFTWTGSDFQNILMLPTLGKHRINTHKWVREQYILTRPFSGSC